ncbi:MAG: hypothetical protein RL065_1517 [Bacteroidota bacterium]|jgi:hypothetical protein
MKKTNKIIYWVSTILLSLGMLGSGIQQIIQNPQMIEIMVRLGYPIYFMVIIGVWKVLAVAAILIPNFKLLKEWAYAGLFFVMTGALISHIIVGDDGVKEILGPGFQTIFILVSWYFKPIERKIDLANQ